MQRKKNEKKMFCALILFAMFIIGVIFIYWNNVDDKDQSKLIRRDTTNIHQVEKNEHQKIHTEINELQKLHVELHNELQNLHDTHDILHLNNPDHHEHEPEHHELDHHEHEPEHHEQEHHELEHHELEHHEPDTREHEHQTHEKIHEELNSLQYIHEKNHENLSAKLHEELHVDIRELEKKHDEFHKGAPQHILENSHENMESEKSLSIANEIREGMKSAFQSYMRDAWKADEYKPVSRRGENSFGGKGLTIIDSLDTLWLMDLKEEYKKALDFVKHDFKFEGRINVFENNIRVLGGLLSAYTLTKEQIFLDKAKHVGEILLTAFKSNVPCGVVNTYQPDWCGFQSWAGGKAINSEIGTLSLEFDTLSKLTGDPKWSNKIKNIHDLWSRHHNELLSMYINANNEQMSGPKTIGGGIDSTYEYLIKNNLLTGDPSIGSLYRKFEEKIINRLLVTYNSRTFVKDTQTNYLEHLGCFGGGMFILGKKYLQEGLKFTETCAEMYTSTQSGIACDKVEIQNNGNIRCVNDIYLLRPEVVESIFYAWRATHDQKWRDYAEKIWKAIDKHCKVSTGGYTDVQHVTRSTPVQLDKQESWFLAETLKYLWLIFQPDDVLSLQEYVLNTECHPLKKFHKL